MARTEKQRDMSFFQKINLFLGRMIGNAKKKEPDVMNAWVDLCTSNGLSPMDRLLQLIQLDVQSGGVDVSSLRQAKRTEEVQQAFDAANISMQMQDVIAKMTQAQMARETQHAEEIMQLRKMYEEIRAVKEIEKPKPASGFSAFGR